MKYFFFSVGIFICSLFFLGCEEENKIQQETKGEIIKEETRDTEKYTFVFPNELGIIPPKDFTLSEEFPGFFHEKKQSSLIIDRFSIGFSEIRATYSDDFFEKEFLSVEQEEKNNIGKYEGVLFLISQINDNTPYKKWMFLLGSNQTSYLITGIFPEKYEEELSEDMKKSVTNILLLEDAVHFENIFEKKDFSFEKKGLTYMGEVGQGMLFFEEENPKKSLLVGKYRREKEEEKKHEPFIRKKLSALINSLNVSYRVLSERGKVSNLPAYFAEVQSENRYYFSAFLFDGEFYYLFFSAGNTGVESEREIFEKRVRSFQKKRKDEFIPSF